MDADSWSVWLPTHYSRWIDEDHVAHLADVRWPAVRAPIALCGKHLVFRPHAGDSGLCSPCHNEALSIFMTRKR